jgi:hypothetical protein
MVTLSLLLHALLALVRRRVLASTSHDSTVRLWDLSALHDDDEGEEEEEEDGKPSNEEGGGGEIDTTTHQALATGASQADEMRLPASTVLSGSSCKGARTADAADGDDGDSDEGGDGGPTSGKRRCKGEKTRWAGKGNDKGKRQRDTQSKADFFSGLL